MHDLDSALRQLRARDETAARHAHALWQVMRATAAHPTRVTRYDVQQMVWGTLPHAGGRRPGPVGVYRDIGATCEAFAELLRLLGHEEYARLCRSETTREILAAAGDADRCAELVTRAWLRSGVRPPDTPLVRWSTRCGPVESALQAAAGRLLEEAIDAGVVPADGADPAGDPERVAVTMRLLTSPDADGGDTWFGQLLDERLDAWTVGNGSQTRRELLVRVRPDVRSVPPAGPGGLPAVQRLLDGCRGGGARLTGRGYLPTGLVRELAELMPTCRELGGSGRSESRWPPVLALRKLVAEFGFVAAGDNRLVLTAVGAALLGDRRALLRRVGEGVVSLDRPALAVMQEVVLSALLLEERMDPERIYDKIAHVLAEDGWAGPDGAGFGRPHAAEVGAWFLRRLRVLDVVEADRAVRRVGLTEAGRAVARWGLRGRVLHREETA